MGKKYTRNKTDYPGVFFIMGKHSSGKPEKIFYIDYRREGKRIEERVGRQFKDKMTPAKANKIRSLRMDGDQLSNAEKRTEVQAAIEEEKGRWTISRLWEEYLVQRVGYKGKGPDSNRFDNYLKPPFGDRAPGDIITLDVDRLRVKMLKTKAPQTVKNTLELLRRIINFGVKRGLCAWPSALHIEMPKVDNIKTEDLTPEQLERLLDVITEARSGPPAWRLAANIMLLALYAGMRREEIFRLQWRDIDTNKGFISIRDPKGGRSQKIPLNDLARGVLESQERTKSIYVFPGRGGAERTDSRVIPQIRTKAGLPSGRGKEGFRPLHGLRHVYASMLASSGQVDLYTLQKLLTHKSAAMTQRYAHLRDEALQRASAVASDLFKEAGKKDEAKVVNMNDHRK